MTETNGVVLPATNPDPAEIGEASWAGAERATREMMAKIRPTAASHRRRKDVIEYVQGLISCHVGCQVFPYGSVPLKTYLPDGDIDLTVFTGSQQLEDVYVTNVHAVLKREENNEAALYHVKDVHRIDAEVRLVKCIVEDMIVDISFNQLGGLCTLHFLEQINHYIGNDHIFKRSIILIKAWCYYESRILGAHHGLISTYALETLVLYIFHLFHSSLDGPLTVLYRFLDYYSKFDWENYCVSLNGRVHKSSMPNVVAEVPDNGGEELLLSEEFIQNCVFLFSVPSKRCEANLRVFPLKNLNIIDPLKENNNLGRSVNIGNFYRICSAFKYGARKLGWILTLPAERISEELKKFFSNTLERYESKCQVTVQNSALLELCDDLDTHSLNHKFNLIEQRCATPPPVFTSPPVSPQHLNDNPWDVTCEALQSQQNIDSQTNVNGLSWGTQVFHTNGSNLYVPPFKDEKNKPRGTGTYIPKAYFQNYRPYKDRHFPGKGRKEAAGTYAPFRRQNFSYEFPAAPPETILPRERNLEFSETGTYASFRRQNFSYEFPAAHSEKISPRERNLEFSETGTYASFRRQNFSYEFPAAHSEKISPRERNLEFSETGTYASFRRQNFSYEFPAAHSETISPRERNLEFSETDFPVLNNASSETSEYRQPQLSIWVPFKENGFSNSVDKPESISSSPQSREEVPMPGLDRLRLSEEERIEEQVFHLKDEEDFPPLTQLHLKEGICIR